MVTPPSLGGVSQKRHCLSAKKKRLRQWNMTANHLLCLKPPTEAHNKCRLPKQWPEAKLQVVWHPAVGVPCRSCTRSWNQSCIISGRWRGRLRSPHTQSMHFAGQFLICRSLKCLPLSEYLNKLPNTRSVSHCWHLLLILAINQFILSWSNPTVLMSLCVWWLRKAVSSPQDFY